MNISIKNLKSDSSVLFIFKISRFCFKHKVTYTLTVVRWFNGLRIKKFEFIRYDDIRVWNNKFKLFVLDFKESYCKLKMLFCLHNIYLLRFTSLSKI